MTTPILCLILMSAAVPDATVEALGRTFAAVAMVESGGDPNCKNGDAGLAVGILQIQPIMVRDCNRILGREEYTLADRRNVSKSVEMWCIYSLHYYPNGTPEQWARAWNGGPDGPRQKCTLPYWRKVESNLK